MTNIKLKICLAILLAATAFSAYSGSTDTFVKATYGTVRTLDPAVVYDTESGSHVRNLYETLIFFDGESTEKFVRSAHPSQCRRFPVRERSANKTERPDAWPTPRQPMSRREPEFAVPRR